MTSQTSTPAPTTSPLWLLLPASVGAAVAVSLGVYGQTHTPTGVGIFTFGFPAVLPMKAWSTTAAFGLAILQVVSALWMYRKLPGVSSTPRWVPAAHRWSGTAAFVLSLPAAYHCLWSLGFQTATTRVAVHSVLGCAFYGVFVAKMLTLRSDRAPSWAVPIAGGVLFAVLVGLWWTSSWWFFTTIGFPGV